MIINLHLFFKKSRPPDYKIHALATANIENPAIKGQQNQTTVHFWCFFRSNNSI